MQVTLTAQPVFDPRKARAWVKAFELPEEADILMTDQELEVGDSKPVENEKNKKEKKIKFQRKF